MPPIIKILAWSVVKLKIEIIIKYLKINHFSRVSRGWKWKMEVYAYVCVIDLPSTKSNWIKTKRNLRKQSNWNDSSQRNGRRSSMVYYTFRTTKPTGQWKNHEKKIITKNVCERQLFGERKAATHARTSAPECAFMRNDHFDGGGGGDAGKYAVDTDELHLIYFQSYSRTRNEYRFRFGHLAIRQLDSKLQQRQPQRSPINWSGHRALCAK